MGERNEGNYRNAGNQGGNDWNVGNQGGNAGNLGGNNLNRKFIKSIFFFFFC